MCTLMLWIMCIQTQEYTHRNWACIAIYGTRWVRHINTAKIKADDREMLNHDWVTPIEFPPIMSEANPLRFLSMTGITTSMHIPNQACPLHIQSVSKGYNLHTTVLKTKMALKGADIYEIHWKIFDWLDNTQAMDTISYLLVPQKNKTKMISVIENHAQFTLNYARKVYEDLSPSSTPTKPPTPKWQFIFFSTHSKMTMVIWSVRKTTTPLFWYGITPLSWWWFYWWKNGMPSKTGSRNILGDNVIQLPKDFQTSQHERTWHCWSVWP